MSKKNPTNPNEEYAVFYEGGAWGGDYASLEIAQGVVCGGLEWNLADVSTTAKKVAKAAPREWTLKHPTGGAVQIVEVL